MSEEINPKQQELLETEDSGVENDENKAPTVFTVEGKCPNTRCLCPDLNKIFFHVTSNQNSFTFIFLLQFWA